MCLDRLDTDDQLLGNLEVGVALSLRVRQLAARSRRAPRSRPGDPARTSPTGSQQGGGAGQLALRPAQTSQLTRVCERLSGLQREAAGAQRGAAASSSDRRALELCGELGAAPWRREAARFHHCRRARRLGRNAIPIGNRPQARGQRQFDLVSDQRERLIPIFGRKREREAGAPMVVVRTESELGEGPALRRADLRSRRPRSPRAAADAPARRAASRRSRLPAGWGRRRRIRASEVSSG